MLKFLEYFLLIDPMSSQNLLKYFSTPNKKDTEENKSVLKEKSKLEGQNVKNNSKKLKKNSLKNKSKVLQADDMEVDKADTKTPKEESTTAKDKVEGKIEGKS